MSLMQTFWRRVPCAGGAVSLPRGARPCRVAPQRNRPTRWSRGTVGCSRSTKRWMSHVLKPLAEGYVKVTPSPVRTGVRNFFGNIGDVWSSVNLFLQGRFKEGAASTMRVAVNSTLGLGGLIDLATPMRLDRFNGRPRVRPWACGVPLSGAYIVWPIIGAFEWCVTRPTSASSMTFSATTLDGWGARGQPGALAQRGRAPARLICRPPICSIAWRWTESCLHPGRLSAAPSESDRPRPDGLREVEEEGKRLNLGMTCQRLEDEAAGCGPEAASAASAPEVVRCSGLFPASTSDESGHPVRPLEAFKDRSRFRKDPLCCTLVCFLSVCVSSAVWPCRPWWLPEAGRKAWHPRRPPVPGRDARGLHPGRSPTT